MGIQNLLRFMKPFIEPVHIKKYAGQRVGIDAYSWLHKGAYSCSLELCMKPKSEAAKRYLNYFMNHINLLQHYNVIPVVVFDGGNIPSKSATESDRNQRKETNLKLAKEKLKEGNTNAAIEFFQKAIHITPSMVHQLIQILRTEKIEYLVAPYEADAQLAYLSNLDIKSGGISAIITEDSDLIAYGCPAVIFKMDKFGNGEEFLAEKVFSTVKEGLCFTNLDQNLFTGMCILAGCDFLPNIQGIGTKRAYSLVSKYKNLDRVLSVLKLDRKFNVPGNYEDSFKKALAVFNHAKIYDLESQSLKPLRPLKDEFIQYLDGDLNILGPEISPSIAKGIAEGDLNPITKEAFEKIIKIPSPKKGIKNAKISILKGQNENFIKIPPMEDSYISIFSSQSTMEEIKLYEDENSSKKFMKEAAALNKLISKPKIISQKAGERETENKIPNNNPFKKIKLSEASKKEISENNEDASRSVPQDLTEESVLISYTPKDVSLKKFRGKNIKKRVNVKSCKVRSDKKDVNVKGSILNFFGRL
ncbi:hypothetical protein LUZ60_011880 [Juncus effusus]|nr:hypothetical protein LUZ60_011880 [Juncus effusus]